MPPADGSGRTRWTPRHRGSRQRTAVSSSRPLGSVHGYWRVGGCPAGSALSRGGCAPRCPDHGWWSIPRSHQLRQRSALPPRKLRSPVVDVIDLIDALPRLPTSNEGRSPSPAMGLVARGCGPGVRAGRDVARDVTLVRSRRPSYERPRLTRADFVGFDRASVRDAESTRANAVVDSSMLPVVEMAHPATACSTARIAYPSAVAR